MSSDSRIEVSVADGVTVVRFADRKIIDSASIEALGDELFALVENENRTKLVLNFESVEFLSSAALNKLIQLDRKLKARSGKLKLCNMRKDIYEVFLLTKLNILFDVKSSEQDAVAAIKD